MNVYNEILNEDSANEYTTMNSLKQETLRGMGYQRNINKTHRIGIK